MELLSPQPIIFIRKVSKSNRRTPKEKTFICKDYSVSSAACLNFQVS